MYYTILLLCRGFYETLGNSLGDCHHNPLNSIEDDTDNSFCLRRFAYQWFVHISKIAKIDKISSPFLGLIIVVVKLVVVLFCWAWNAISSYSVELALSTCATWSGTCCHSHFCCLPQRMLLSVLQMPFTLAMQLPYEMAFLSPIKCSLYATFLSNP